MVREIPLAQFDNNLQQAGPNQLIKLIKNQVLIDAIGDGYIMSSINVVPILLYQTSK